VDAETWQKVRARDATGFNSPHARPRYLLSGLLVCDECGRAMTLIGGKGQRYVCATNHAGGDAACSNRLGVPRLVAEDLVLEPVEERFVSDSAVKEMVAELHRIYTGRQSEPRPKAKADPRIAELRRMVTVGTLSEEEARPALARLEATQPKPVIPDVDSLARAVEARAKAFREALHGKAVSVARDALRRLVGSIRCVPIAVPEAKGGGYLMAHFDRGSQSLPLHDWFSIGNGRGVGTVVAGAGFEPATFGL
jgi:site-specific DNA recombinase